MQTEKAKRLMGYIDGQTTNPSLIAKNPEIKARIEKGEKFTEEELLSQYRRIVQQVAKVTNGPTSIEVYADEKTSAEQIIKQAQLMAEWIPNAYIKIPITKEGLKAGEVLGREIKLNFTLCFTQEQAAAVYSATKGAAYPVFVSPFVGRLDDQGENGMDLVANILSMFAQSDGHVQVLTASVRNLDHLLYALKLKSPAITVPFAVFEQWAQKGFPIPTLAFVYDKPNLKPIAYKTMSLDEPWSTYNIKHPLTDKGLWQFASDWQALLRSVGS